MPSSPYQEYETIRPADEMRAELAPPRSLRQRINFAMKQQNERGHNFVRWEFPSGQDDVAAHALLDEYRAKKYLVVDEYHDRPEFAGSKKTVRVLKATITW